MTVAHVRLMALGISCVLLRVRRTQAGTPRTWRELEAQMLDGTRLQGVCTSNEVQEVSGGARQWAQEACGGRRVGEWVQGGAYPRTLTRGCLREEGVRVRGMSMGQQGA